MQDTTAFSLGDSSKVEVVDGRITIWSVCNLLVLLFCNFITFIPPALELGLGELVFALQKWTRGIFLQSNALPLSYAPLGASFLTCYVLEEISFFFPCCWIQGQLLFPFFSKIFNCLLFGHVLTMQWSSKGHTGHSLK